MLSGHSPAGILGRALLCATVAFGQLKFTELGEEEEENLQSLKAAADAVPLVPGVAPPGAPVGQSRAPGTPGSGRTGPLWLCQRGGGSGAAQDGAGEWHGDKERDGDTVPDPRGHGRVAGVELLWAYKDFPEISGGSALPQLCPRPRMAHGGRDLVGLSACHPLLPLWGWHGGQELRGGRAQPGTAG